MGGGDDMDNDDALVGRVLTRREAVRLLAASGTATALAPAGLRAAALAGAGAPALLPACVVQPEMTEGPYFVDRRLQRSDIRIEPSTGAVSAGAPLALAFTVSQVGPDGCRPLPGATVDVWQCDSAGRYSGVTDPGDGDALSALSFLRGAQVTDEQGRAAFLTIYPGWYRGRAVHIHFKIRTSTPMGQAWEFTSQLFFDDALTDRVHGADPYASRGVRDMRNRDDGIFRQAGEQMVLQVAPEGEGYRAAFDLGMDLSDAAVGRPDGMGRGFGGRGRGGPRGDRG
jgi:protocatechuate 3,4-dioxygenase beta subunit